MATPSVTKTIRIPCSLHARLVRRARAQRKDFSTVLRDAALSGLGEDEGVDMAAALAGIVGRYAGSGECQRERMKRYGRPRVG